MSAFVLIVITTAVTFNNVANHVSNPHQNVNVAMQEFGSERACVFAQQTLLRRAKSNSHKINAVCVPKGFP